MEIPVRGGAWRAGSGRVAGVSAFGFSGTNAHVVLEEAPREAAKARRGANAALPGFVRAERDGSRQLGRTLRGIFARTPIDLGDVCFTRQQRTRPFRTSVWPRRARKCSNRRRKALPGRSASGKGLPVFLFRAGCPIHGDGSELFETEPVFRRAMEECAAAVKAELEPGLMDVLWGPSSDTLRETAYTQPALFAIEYAIANLWRSWGVEPAAVLGHSVGEYVAACVAGVFSLADGLKLIAARARLMSDLPHGEGSMAAILAPLERVEPALEAAREWVSVAGLNGLENTVISGRAVESRTDLRGLGFGRSAGGTLASLACFPFLLMNPMLNAFAARAGQVEFRAPRIVLVSSLTGQPAKLAELRDPSYWRRQVREPVRFQQGWRRWRRRVASCLWRLGRVPHCWASQSVPEIERAALGAVDS